MSVSTTAPDRAGAHYRGRFAARTGSALLIGVQAVCRVPSDARRIDERHGRDTMTFVTGYQGPTLATIDFAPRRLGPLLQILGADRRTGMDELLGAITTLAAQRGSPGAMDPISPRLMGRIASAAP